MGRRFQILIGTALLAVAGPAPWSAADGLPAPVALPAPREIEGAGPAPVALPPPAVEEESRPPDDPALRRTQNTPLPGGARRPPAQVPAPAPAPLQAPAPAAQPGGEGVTLPPAVEKPGHPAGAGGGGAPHEAGTPSVVAAERLPIGKQGVGLTVEV